MSKVKFVCPQCGSENIVGWKQKTMEINYYLNSTLKNGTYISKRKIPRSLHDTVIPETWGYQCDDCGESCTEYTEYADEWRKEVIKND